jgi:dTDP-4-dehydrorhamnose 3,5-epimerase
MRFHETALAGAFLIEIEPHTDMRGLFARTWCAQEFAARGLATDCVQASLSRNDRRGTVRGMHLQLPPSRESKLVRCARGSILDVLIDLRPESPSYLQHFAIELSAQACNALYVPPLMAHGFQTLVDETDVVYQMSDFYAPQHAFGLRWDDPSFRIRWPIRQSVTILPRDLEYPDFDPGAYAQRLQVPRAPAES